MGMDVEGRNPSSPDGESFRANIWGWGVILEAISKSGGDLLLGPDTRRSIAFNDGGGPEDQATCTSLADLLEAMDDPDPRVTRFIPFLRACGGFRVY